MKKIVSIALAFVMIFGVFNSVPYTESSFTITAEATGASVPTDDSYFSFDYRWDSATGEEFLSVVGFYGGVSDVVIPSEYMGEPVVGIDYFAFTDNKEITSVVMPETIKYLHEAAFTGCSNLESITISGNVCSDAFSTCSKLTDVTFLPTVQEIGERAFLGTSIKKLVIPEGVKRIGSESFAAIMTLETIQLPASLEYIDETAFEYDGNITEFYFMGTREQWQDNNGANLIKYIYDGPLGLKIGVHYGTAEHVMVDYYSFGATCTEPGEKTMKCEYCSYSENEIVPPLGHSMGGWEIVRQATCTTSGIKENYCLECDYCESEEIPVIRHSFLDGKCKSCGVDIIKFDYNETYGYAKVVQYNGYGDVVIPDESEGYPVTTLWNEIFTCPESITSITLGKNIDFLSPSMYEGCVALENLFVAEGNEYFKSVDGIWFSADGKTLVKYPCGRQTESYIIPGEVTCLDDFAFAYNESLKSVNIHNGVSIIKTGGFAHCTSLESIKIPDSVTTIGASCFYGCTNLENIEIGNGVEHIGSYTFCDCENIESIKLGSGIKKLGNLAFAGSTIVGHLVLPYGLETIGNYAFEFCKKLESVAIPLTATNISYGAFDRSGIKYFFYQGTREQYIATGASMMNGMHFETDYHIFEDNACKDCGLQEFKYSWISDTASITKYNGRSKVVVVPSDMDGRKVVSIGSGVFTSVEEIFIPDSVTNIDENAINPDAVIYCYENSYAHIFSEENGYMYELVSLHSVSDSTTIDYDNKLIKSDDELCSDLNKMISTSSEYTVCIDGEPVSSSTVCYGTGSVIEIYDGETLVDRYSVIVSGDTNGDSVCDALDAAQVAMAANGVCALDSVYKIAGDRNDDKVVDINDYQAIVNMVIS